MSKLRKSPKAGRPDSEAAGAAPVVAFARDYEAGYAIPAHTHDQDQLIYASRGVMTVHTEQGAWVVPTHRAVWVPAGVPHSIAMSGTVAMRTLYFRRRLARGLPRTCCVVNVSPLLNALILHACDFGGLAAGGRRARHVIGLIIDQLEDIQVVPIRLPMPLDPRALRAARFLIADPDHHESLAKACRAAGACRRTIERLFQEDTGLSLGRWRRQLSLVRAMQALGEAAPLASVAFDAGYSTPSAFIAAFKKTFGLSPIKYMRAGTKGDGGRPVPDVDGRERGGGRAK